ncbi:uncharacterized protein LOC135378755 isoform X2 [Ornithodoros turicata]|uniref:uncharacterized protein LOC135378755 isoform X2 n=1 Tax=Ornithodoros turicata TaxID=34597 RepID=UPI003139D246
MSSAVPTFAYVVYKDGARAIVAVSLIKDYAPSTVNDVSKNKSVYWRSKGKHAAVDEGFYDADVVELGLTQSDLVQRLSKRKIAVPDNIFEDTQHPIRGKTGKTVSAKTATRNALTARKRKLAEILSQEEDSSSSEDDMVPKKLLLEEQKKVSVLRQKLNGLREKHEELQMRHGRLEDVLYNKLEVWFMSQGRSNSNLQEPSNCMSQTVFDSEGTESQEETTGPVTPPPPASPKSASPSLLLSAAPGPAQDREAAVNVMPLLPGTSLLAATNTIHLGSGVYVPLDRWQWLLRRSRDSLFCKEATRVVWGPAALRGRSVTGAPCRRFLKTGTNASEKRALTPQKLHAVGNAFDRFISLNNTQEAVQSRRAKMNRYIAEMLKDLK